MEIIVTIFYTISIILIWIVVIINQKLLLKQLFKQQMQLFDLCLVVQELKSKLNKEVQQNDIKTTN